jgi:hypothetical protein
MGNKGTLASLPPCPRCDSARTEQVSESPVPGAWVIYTCGVCFYTWRSTEPDYATRSECFDPRFKIPADKISEIAQVPFIPPLRDLK